MTDTNHAPRAEIRDASVMRALASPARLSIMERLMAGDPATATECAEIIGLTPSATSYHLRALAKAGLVEEAPGRGDGRERLWRSLVRGFDVEAGHNADQDTRDAERELVDSFMIREETRVRQWLARSHEEPAEWYQASIFSEVLLMLTAEELQAIGKQLLAVLDPYRGRSRSAPLAGQRQVSLLLRAIAVDSLPPAEPVSDTERASADPEDVK